MPEFKVVAEDVNARTMLAAVGLWMARRVKWAIEHGSSSAEETIAFAGLAAEINDTLRLTAPPPGSEIAQWHPDVNPLLHECLTGVVKAKGVNLEAELKEILENAPGQATSFSDSMKREMVEDFHSACGAAIAEEDFEYLTAKSLTALRAKLVSEEASELSAALNKGCAAEVLDAIVDLEYVLTGLKVSLGVSDKLVGEAWREVHAANMRKFANGVKLREDGKVLKPEGWEGPNIHKVLSTHADDDFSCLDACSEQDLNSEVE